MKNEAIGVPNTRLITNKQTDIHTSSIDSHVDITRDAPRMRNEDDQHVRALLAHAYVAPVRRGTSSSIIALGQMSRFKHLQLFVCVAKSLIC